MTDTDTPALMIIIEDVTYNKKKCTYSSMGLVKSDIALYSTTTNSKDTSDEFNMGELQGGKNGYHRTLYYGHFNAYAKRRVMIQRRNW